MAGAITPVGSKLEPKLPLSLLSLLMSCGVIYDLSLLSLKQDFKFEQNPFMDSGDIGRAHKLSMCVH